MPLCNSRNVLTSESDSDSAIHDRNRPLPVCPTRVKPPNTEAEIVKYTSRTVLLWNCRPPDAELSAHMEQAQQVQHAVVVATLPRGNGLFPEGLSEASGLIRIWCGKTSNCVHGNQPRRAIYSCL